jgi:hypothetical protein
VAVSVAGKVAMKMDGVVHVSQTIQYCLDSCTEHFSNPVQDNQQMLKGVVSVFFIALINLFQSNFSATHILASSYLFWAGKRLVDYL